MAGPVRDPGLMDFRFDEMRILQLDCGGEMWNVNHM